MADIFGWTTSRCKIHMIKDLQEIVNFLGSHVAEQEIGDLPSVKYMFCRSVEKKSYMINTGIIYPGRKTGI